jgi:hypothetical protein
MQRDVETSGMGPSPVPSSRSHQLARGVTCLLVAAGLWVPSCGASESPGGTGDAGGPGNGEARANQLDADVTQCPSPGALAAEPPPRQVALDGGVPLDKYLYALAVARCNFYIRHFALSTYVANNCVDQMVAYNSFEFPPGTGCYVQPRHALLQAAAAGVVRYDPQQASRCIAAPLFPWERAARMTMNVNPRSPANTMSAVLSAVRSTEGPSHPVRPG